MSFNLIKPAFLKRADRYLLTHYPIIWQSRIIWVAFYSLGVFALAYYIGDYFDIEVNPLVDEPHSFGNHSDYFNEINDLVFFTYIPLFLSGLMVLYWLYTQFQQKVDYSKLSVVSFLGTTLLNFACIVLMFLPVLGLSEATLDSQTNFRYGMLYVQLVISLGLPIAILPFIIRQFSLIEIVVVVFAGFAYCVAIALGLSLMGVKDFEGVMGVYFVNYVVLTGITLTYFVRRTYTQHSKRLMLLCLLCFPLIFPTLLHFGGAYYNLKDAYRGISDEDALFTLKWLLLHITTVLVIYSVVVRFIYRATLYPIKRK